MNENVLVKIDQMNQSIDSFHADLLVRTHAMPNEDFDAQTERTSKLNEFSSQLRGDVFGTIDRQRSFFLALQSAFALDIHSKFRVVFEAYRTNANDSDANYKALEAERDGYAGQVKTLTIQRDEYKAALAAQKFATATADKRADNAEIEVVHQKRKVSRWKKLAEYETLIGAGIGAAAVILIQK